MLIKLFDFQLKLVEPALLYCCENGISDFASLIMQHCKNLSKSTVQQAHLKFGLALEKQNRFQEAETHYIDAGQPREAVEMYVHNKMWPEAQRVAAKYGIGDKLPILIAEKMGPHFAVGDTCYSHEEDLATYNPDGKRLIAKENEVSPLYECGDNDHLLVIVLTKINKEGYRQLDDESVKSYVRSEVVRDKKAEMLMAQAKGVKSVSAAKGKGAKVSTVNQVTFAAPVFVQTTGMSEPALSGAVAATAKGKFCAQPIKGNGGVFVLQPYKKTRPVKFNEKEYEQRQRQKVMQYAGNFMQELYFKAGVKDNRYMFF